MLIIPSFNEPRFRPSINTGEDLKSLSERAISALVASNSPPWLFVHGNQLVRVQVTGDGHPFFEEITEDRLVHYLARKIRWQRRKVNGVRVPARPPREVAKFIRAAPEIPFPMVERIVQSPTFDRNGNLHVEAGYQPATASIYAPSKGFDLIPVDDDPVDAVLLLALDCINELFADFPFTSPTERTHAVAALLLPFVRSLIQGPTPLYLIEKPVPGTGATLLAQVICDVALGHSVPAMVAPKDEPEWRRTILAALRGGPAVILIDNVRDSLESATLAAAITADFLQDRLIRSSDVICAPVRCLWLATANNPILSDEISRRVIRIRLDAQVERPELRTDFRHPKLRLWVKDERPWLVWSVVTIVNAWIARGRPRARKIFGGFEDWAEVVGGILEVAGFQGFLENTTEVRSAAGNDDEFKALLSKWWDCFRTEPIRVSQLLPLTRELDFAIVNKHGRGVRLGKLLSRNRDRKMGDFCVRQVGMRQGYMMWRLERSE